MSVTGRAMVLMAAIAATGAALTARSAVLPERVTDATEAGALRSAGALAFGPAGILFVGDSRGGAVHAVPIEDAAPDPHKGAVSIAHVDKKIAALLGATVDDIVIHDMVSHPKTRHVYFSVTNGRGDTGRPVLVQSTLDGGMTIVPHAVRGAARFSLRDAPTEQAKTPWGSSARAMAITDLAFVDGELLVAGLSNEAFASTLRRVPYPFTAGGAATTLEIYHTSHGRYETASPIETFLPFVVNGKPSLLAGYGCAPLALFEMGALRGGAHVRGATLAELGGGNRPSDMVTIEQDGTRHVIVANSNRTLMRIAAADIERATPLTRRSTLMYESFGMPYVSIAQVGVLQLDTLGPEFLLLLQRDIEKGSLDLRTHPTKYL